MQIPSIEIYPSNRKTGPTAPRHLLSLYVVLRKLLHEYFSKLCHFIMYS